MLPKLDQLFGREVGATGVCGSSCTLLGNRFNQLQQLFILVMDGRKALKLGQEARRLGLLSVVIFVLGALLFLSVLDDSR